LTCGLSGPKSKPKGHKGKPVGICMLVDYSVAKKCQQRHPSILPLPSLWLKRETTEKQI
jgi:hypothetical protein